MPPAITIPNRIANTGEIVWPCQICGVLGQTYDPWLITCDPSKPEFAIPDLALPAELPKLRFDRRLSLLDQVNRHLDGLKDAPAVVSMGRWCLAPPHSWLRHIG